MIKLIVPRVPDRLFELRLNLGGWLLRFAEWLNRVFCVAGDKLEWTFYCLGARLLGGYMVEVDDGDTISKETD